MELLGIQAHPNKTACRLANNKIRNQNKNEDEIADLLLSPVVDGVRRGRAGLRGRRQAGLGHGGGQRLPRHLAADYASRSFLHYNHIAFNKLIHSTHA